MNSNPCNLTCNHLLYIAFSRLGFVFGALICHILDYLVKAVAETISIKQEYQTTWIYPFQPHIKPYFGLLNTSDLSSFIINCQ